MKNIVVIIICTIISVMLGIVIASYLVPFFVKNYDNWYGCPKCSFNTIYAGYCPFDGNKLENFKVFNCPKCGAWRTPSAEYCRKCGSMLEQEGK